MHNDADAKVTTQCLRCGRTLKAQRSIAAGYGRTCRARVQAAANVIDLTAYKAAQLASAQELIEDGAIIALPSGAYQAVSSDGTDTYLTTAHTCTCPAGDKGRRCYHRAAAAILTAA